jgi:hypothetical protein
MGAKGDKHVHHPVCEACGKEFADTHQLSVHARSPIQSTSLKNQGNYMGGVGDKCPRSIRR